MLARRDFIRRLIVSLLVVVFGPRVRELVEWSEVDKLAAELDGKWVVYDPSSPGEMYAELIRHLRRDRIAVAMLGQRVRGC